MSSLALYFMAAWLMMGVANAALSPGERRYPPSALVIDVTKPPYLAKGDG
ncbi:MAG: hypothetical protein IT580_18520, partial [Verrucomicrobiales bacterium]|nr:hypothetical protein [Verrucomicrobiales bacterium]